MLSLIICPKHCNFLKSYVAVLFLCLHQPSQYFVVGNIGLCCVFHYITSLIFPFSNSFSFSAAIKYVAVALLLFSYIILMACFTFVEVIIGLFSPLISGIASLYSANSFPIRTQAICPPIHIFRKQHCC